MANPLGKKNKSKIKMSYEIIDDYAIFTTHQKDPVKFIVDKEDIDKVLEHNWTNHSYKYYGQSYLVYRYEDEKGKYKTIPLSKHLGYGKSYTHRNGNNLDFRKSNMRIKKSVYDAISRNIEKRKEEKENEIKSN